MKYKEFKKYCNDRCFDGCWGMDTAILCISVMRKINREPFWKREKIWRKIYEDTIVLYICVEKVKNYLMQKEKVK